MKAPIIWFTGLPCAGKTTLAKQLVAHLRGAGMVAYNVDGDEARRLLLSSGYSEENRIANHVRMAGLARVLSSLGVWVVVSALAPTRAIQREVEKVVAPCWIYVDTLLEECEKRDVKGHYAEARAGRRPGFTGIDAPYEPPANLFATVGTQGPVKKSLHEVLMALRGADLLPARPRFWYEKMVGAEIGDKFVSGYSLTPEGCTFLRRHLVGASSVLEMGMGMSTIVIAASPPLVHVAADHDGSWRGTMEKLMRIAGFRMPTIRDTADIRSAKPRGCFDVILVDHGPTMETRLNDIPLLVAATKRGGVLLFDDMRATTRYRKQVTGALAKLGLKLDVPAISGPENRKIGVVRV